MKYVKMLGLLAVAAAALMAFAGTATAAELTSPTGETYNGTIHATSEGHAILDPPSLPAIECESTVHGHVATNPGNPVTGTITSLIFSPCTNSWHVTTVNAGELSINSAGEVSSSGATVESTRLGITCRYATSGTTVGELTDSHETGATATMHIHGQIPFHSGSGLCGSGSTTWEGSYIVNTPMNLYLDA